MDKKPQVNRSSYIGALSPEYAILGMLARQPAHGYELYARLVNDLGQVWHLSMSQVYNILNRLEAQGYLAATVQEQEKLPARRLLQLTEAGRNRFDRWLFSTAGCSVRAIRVEFTTRLYFCQSLSPGRVDDLVAAQKAEVVAGIERLRAGRRDTPSGQLINRLALDLRIRQLESVLTWLDECASVLSWHTGQDIPEGK